MKSPALALAITLLIQALVSLAALTAPVLAPVVALDTGLAATKVGVFVALIYVAAMLSSLCSGDFVIRYGAIRISQLCLVSCSAGVAIATLGSPWAMVVGALLIGCGYGPVTPASSHILARNTPPHLMGFIFSLKQTGVPLGGALAGILLPAWVGWWDWRTAAYIAAALCLVVVVLSQPIRGSFDNDRDSSRKLAVGSAFRPLKLVLENKRIRDLAICTTFFSVMQLCLTTYLVTFLTDAHDMSLQAAGLILFAAQAAGVAGRLLWGAVADRWMAPRNVLAVLAFGIGVCSLALAMIPAHWPLWLLTLLCIAFGATAIGWNGVYLAEVARLAPAGQAGLFTGGTLFFTYFGVVAGPPAFALVVEYSESYSVGYGILGVAITLVAVWLTYASAKELQLTRTG